jgi:hypothetical protein
MYIAVTTRTRGKLHVRDALHTFRSMDAHNLFLDYFGMTARTIHRIEPAPLVVPAFTTDVAIETFRRAVRGALEERHIDFVAVVARMLHLGVGPWRREWHADEYDGE